MRTFAFIVVLLAFGAEAQVGDCGPGKQCQSTSFQSPCVPSSRFLACTTARKGTMQCASDGMDGGSASCWALCNGTAWACATSGGGSGGGGTDTCTGDTCTIGDGGTYWDGGNSGAVYAMRFVASISGNGTTAFECRNQTAASSPCINNPSNIMELFATPTNRNQASATFPDFLFLSQAPDGGRKVAGYLLGVLSGPSDAELPEFGVTHNGGIELNLSAQGGVYTQNANATGQAADMVTPQGYWRRLGGSTGAGGPAFIDWQNVGTKVTSGDFYQWYDRDATTITALTYQGGVRVGSAVTASLQTCAAGTAGTLVRDSTSGLSRVKQCDGAQYVYPTAHLGGFMPGLATIAAADNFRIANTRMYSGGNVQRISVTTLLGGTMAGAETYTVDVYDNTTSTVLCTKAAVACNSTTISSADCANASYAAFDDIYLRVNCSTCTTCPMMIVNAEYQ